jgi:hypothetical protein
MKPLFGLSMIFSENRYPLFRIMLAAAGRVPGAFRRAYLASFSGQEQRHRPPGGPILRSNSRGSGGFGT